MSRIAFALSLILVAGCDSRPWMGFVYPDRGDLTGSRIVGEFSTLEDCRLAARAYFNGSGGMANGDYECGYKCKPQLSGAVPYICKRTER